MNNLQSFVLGVVLLLVAIAAGYDFLIARPTFNGAAMTVNKLLERDGAFNLTEIQLHHELGRNPTETRVIEGRNVLLERYSVRRGLMFSTFDLYVWYARSNDDWEYAGHKIGTAPQGDELPSNPGSRVRIAHEARDFKIVIGSAVTSSSTSPYENPTEHLDKYAEKEPAEPEQSDSTEGEKVELNGSESPGQAKPGTDQSGEG